MSLFNELKRRNVIRVATAYVVTAWLVIQVAQTVFVEAGWMTEDQFRLVVIVLAIIVLARLGLLPLDKLAEKVHPGAGNRGN